MNNGNKSTHTGRQSNDFGGGMFSIELSGHSTFSENIDCWTLGLKKLSLLNLSHPDLYSCLDFKKSGGNEVKLYHLTGEAMPGSSPCHTSSSPSVHTSTNGKVGPTVAAGRAELVNLLLHLSDWRRNNNATSGRPSSAGGRLAVVSHDGISKVGVFCAATYCYEQIDARNQVDVFQAVRNCKKVRPQMVRNITEYKFCYDLVLENVSKKMRQEMSV